MERFHFFLLKSKDLGCSFSDPSTRNLDCLQARHVLCLQPRHLLCQQSWLASWLLAGRSAGSWLPSSWLAGVLAAGWPAGWPRLDSGGRPGKSVCLSGEGANLLGGPTRLLDSNCRTVQDLGRMVHVKHRGCLPAWICTSDRYWLRGIVPWNPHREHAAACWAQGARRICGLGAAGELPGSGAPPQPAPVTASAATQQQRAAAPRSAPQQQRIAAQGTIPKLPLDMS